jgi:hypothetical protein
MLQAGKVACPAQPEKGRHSSSHALLTISDASYCNCTRLPQEPGVVDIELTTTDTHR